MNIIKNQLLKFPPDNIVAKANKSIVFKTPSPVTSPCPLSQWFIWISDVMRSESLNRSITLIMGSLSMV